MVPRKEVQKVYSQEFTSLGPPKLPKIGAVRPLIGESSTALVDGHMWLVAQARGPDGADLHMSAFRVAAAELTGAGQSVPWEHMGSLHNLKSPEFATRSVGVGGGGGGCLVINPVGAWELML